MSDDLATAYPRLAQQVPKTHLADLPTPIVQETLNTAQGQRRVAIKCDNLTSKLYGGNKVRKLEYLLHRASEKKAERVVTFGTVASNHALATALYAKSLGFECTCLLSHQTRTANAARMLNMHLQNGTEILHYGGDYSHRVDTMRRSVQGRQAWIIPIGGSNCLGAVGFVNAGLELAGQIATGELDVPDRLYVANGTMATAVGLALGLALANLPTEIQAVRVTADIFANPKAMRRLLVKTATFLNAFDASIPADLADRARYCLRDEFFGGGYARTNSATDRAIETARAELGLMLETTYTGKAMAAMLYDLERAEHAGQSMLFWNTYNSRPLPAGVERPSDVSRLPKEFLRYFD
ncbi:MAG: pyridoxal-phosphate dependent enzyme [Gammaproteobacteria bacterium]|nr:pyridoxal-phosphate dependent enzyme [Gammaproteobacteria bacterium]MDH3750920.1 pyridoxal-phosphate dependent enzyme [Gammaproteobacteria bacterium]MDH3805320.1 pyridoxal-phosphate dependent enzyme [Gammaproteobacteria bacterium]